MFNHEKLNLNELHEADVTVNMNLHIVMPKDFIPYEKLWDRLDPHYKMMTQVAKKELRRTILLTFQKVYKRQGEIAMSIRRATREPLSDYMIAQITLTALVEIVQRQLDVYWHG